MTRRDGRKMTAVKLWGVLGGGEAERPQLQEQCSCGVAGLDRLSLNTNATLQTLGMLPSERIHITSLFAP
jgi:hypothetical protein